MQGGFDAKAQLVTRCDSPASTSDCESLTGLSPGSRTLSGSRTSRSQPFFIGVAGGTASGKTTVCDAIMQKLGDQCVAILNQDSFYRELSEEERRNVHDHNFDHPDAFDGKALVSTLQDLMGMQAVDVPIYDFSQHKRSSETRRVEPADVVLLEGILALAMDSLRAFLHMKIFVDTDDDVRLARRIQRDVSIRGRDISGVIEQYQRFVKPAFDTFVAPSRRHADVIIPWAGNANEVAIDLITEHIRSKLRQPDLRRIYTNLEVMPSNFQIRGMHTIIRDRETSTDNFVFYTDRLLRLAKTLPLQVVEAGLGCLPFSEMTVITPPGRPYVGVEFAKRLCGVSVIRSGEAMENALRACCKGIKIGKILVHRHKPCKPPANGPGMSKNEACAANESVEEELIYEKLPQDIADRHVLLMDPILGTGNSASRAIQVLLKKGVSEQNIVFLSLIAAPEGIHRVCATFPLVKVVTSEIDEGIGSRFQVHPGIGEFGDRYFGD